MKNILIDPYMFELSEIQEIKENICFFQEIIQLCKGKRIAIFLDQMLYKRIAAGEEHPFPIDVNNLEDSVLKEQVLMINGGFRYAVLSMGQPVDIGECFDKANLTSGKKEIDEDSLYYEMLSVLMMPCYSEKTVVLEDKIITGNKKQGLGIGTQLYVKCNCDSRNFEENYIFSGVDELYSEKEGIFFELQEQVKNGVIIFSENPEATRGEHHNHVQAKEFECYAELTRKNRTVLTLLRSFGMKRIIFEKFYQDPGKVVGYIKGKQVEQVDSQDIIHAEFFTEQNYRYSVRIFFPKGVGKNLYIYLDGDFSYQKIERLKSSLGL